MGSGPPVGLPLSSSLLLPSPSSHSARAGSSGKRRHRRPAAGGPGRRPGTGRSRRILPRLGKGPGDGGDRGNRRLDRRGHRPRRSKGGYGGSDGGGSVGRPRTAARLPTSTASEGGVVGDAVIVFVFNLASTQGAHARTSEGAPLTPTVGHPWAGGNGGDGSTALTASTRKTWEWGGGWGVPA